MKLANPLIIKCLCCNEIIEVETELECISSNERSMGYECEYESIIEDSCPNCENSISLRLSVWEYPLGAICFQEEDIQGAELLDGPEYNPFDSDFL